MISELKGHKETITGISLSNSEKYIASSSWDYTIRVWEIKLEKEVFCIYAH